MTRTVIHIVLLCHTASLSIAVFNDLSQYLDESLSQRELTLRHRARKHPLSRLTPQPFLFNLTGIISILAHGDLMSDGLDVDGICVLCFKVEHVVVIDRL